MINRAVFEAARITSNALFGPGLTLRSPLANKLYASVAWLNRRIHPAYRRWNRFMAANPCAPWWVPEAVPWLEQNIRPGMKAFEWGSGRSTVWLAEHGIRVTSVELDPKWHDWVRERAPAAEVILTTWSHEKYAELIEAGAPYDLTIVDGFYRRWCLPRAMQATKPGGIIVVDNADDAIVRSIVKHWRGRLLASFDNGVDRTNFYKGGRHVSLL